MSSPSFKLVWENYGLVAQEADTGTGSRGTQNNDIEDQNRVHDQGGPIPSQAAKEYVLKRHLSDTGAGQMIEFLSSARAEAMKTCEWHRLLFQMPSDQKLTTGGERVKIRRQLKLSTVEDLFVEENRDLPGPSGGATTRARQENDPINGLPRENAVLMRKSVDLDTMEVVTNRLDVFNQVTLIPVRNQRSISNELESLNRGRACLIPFSYHGTEGGYLPKLILVSGRGTTQVDEDYRNKLWPWKSKRYIGMVRQGSESFLYVCQMATSKRTAVNVVAWAMVVEYIRALINSDNDLEPLGASSAAVPRIGRRPNEMLNVATYSRNICIDFMTRLHDLDHQDQFLTDHDQKDIASAVKKNSRVGDPVDEWSDHKIFDELRSIFRKMVRDIWFATTIQYAREQQGSLYTMYSNEDGSSNKVSDNSKTYAVSERFQSRICSEVSPSKVAPSEIFIIPSIAVELSMVKRQRGQTKLLTVSSDFFESRQYIRLHLTQDKVREEKKQYERITEDSPTSDRPPPAKFDTFSQWGSKSILGPCGLKSHLHVESRLKDARSSKYKLVDLMQPIAIEDDADLASHPILNDGVEEDWDPEMVTPVLSAYETTIRGYDKFSPINLQQKECLQTMLDLASGEGTPSEMHRKRKGLRKKLEENVERFLSQEPKGVPFRFEDVSAIHISSDPTTRDQQEVKDRYSEAIGCLLVTRIAKLLAIRFEKLLSYSHSDEYPELVRTVKEWLKILDIRADIEIQSNQRCSLETINSFSLCIGMLAHMFFGVDRALTDQLPMSLHFRSRSGREIARSFAEQGMFTVPPYLLLALFEPRRIKQGNLTFGLLEEDNETTFLLRDYMFALALGKRSIDGRSKFNFWCHMTAEIMKFSPPSVLSLLLLHYIAASICETLVRHHNFHMKVRVKTRNRAKTVWQVSNHEIYEMYHVDDTNTDGQGRPEVTKLNTKPRFGGIDADKYGALFIFDPENFRTIIRCLKHASASGIGGVRPQFKEDQQEIHRILESYIFNVVLLPSFDSLPT